MTEPNLPPDLDWIPDPAPAELRTPAFVAPVTVRAGRRREDFRRARRLALWLGSGWIAAQLAITGIRGDMQHVPLGYTLACGVAPLLAGVTCLIAALHPGRLGLGGRVTLLAALALSLPLAFVLSGHALSPPYPEAPRGDLKHGMFCFNIAIAWTVLPLVAAGVALKSTFVSRAVWRSALVGAGAGLIVATTSMLRCPLSDSWHMTLSHGGAVLASALIGAFVLSRVTRV